MTLTFDQRLTAPPNVLMQELQGESVFLNIPSERYFGLDEVGTRMWTLLTSSPSIQDAYDKLLEEFDVDPEQLRKDLNELLLKLVDHGLVEVAGQ